MTFQRFPKVGRFNVQVDTRSNNYSKYLSNVKTSCIEIVKFTSMALTNNEFQKEIERNGEIIKKTNPKASREKVKEEVNIRRSTIKSIFV